MSVGFAFGPRRWVIASALIAIAALAAVLAAAGTQSAPAATFRPDGNKCIMQATFEPDNESLTLVHESHWPTDYWGWPPPSAYGPINTLVQNWGSSGGLFRGCHNDVRYRVGCFRGTCSIPTNEPPYYFRVIDYSEPIGMVEISETMPWSGSQSAHCVVHSVGDFRFPEKSCKVKDEVAPFGTLGARELMAHVWIYLGRLCVRDLSLKRPIELCL